jgi:hypothetical protein
LHCSLVHPVLLFYSVYCQTILLVKWRALGLNGLTKMASKFLNVGYEWKIQFTGRKTKPLVPVPDRPYFFLPTLLFFQRDWPCGPIFSGWLRATAKMASVVTLIIEKTMKIFKKKNYFRPTDPNFFAIWNRNHRCFFLRLGMMQLPYKIKQTWLFLVKAIYLNDHVKCQTSIPSATHLNNYLSDISYHSLYSIHLLRWSNSKKC